MENMGVFWLNGQNCLNETWRRIAYADWVFIIQYNQLSFNAIITSKSKEGHTE